VRGTHPRICRTATPPAIALAQLRALQALSKPVLIAEGEDHLPRLEPLALDARIRGATIQDAHVAAICLAHGVAELWSADREFARLPAVTVRNPLIGRVRGRHGTRALPAGHALTRSVRRIGETLRSTEAPRAAVSDRLSAPAHMFLRYCPPTSNSAFVICPSEHTRTASISASNTLPSAITVSRSRRSIATREGALVAGIGHALIEAGHRVLFTRTGDLVQRLQAARRDLRLPQELAKLDRFDLLILDDISYVRRDQAETSVLFELIAERYERRSMAITANTPFSEWGAVFHEPAMTVAAIDRLVHHSTILEMNVESYRRRATQPGHAPAGRKTK
jgi:hypothetical protein